MKKNFVRHMGSVLCVFMALLLLVSTGFAADQSIAIYENQVISGDIDLNVDYDSLDPFHNQQVLGVHAGSGDVDVSTAPGVKIKMVFSDDAHFAGTGIMVDNEDSNFDTTANKVTATFGDVAIDNAAVGLSAVGSTAALSVDKAVVTNAANHAVHAEDGGTIHIGDDALLTMNGDAIGDWYNNIATVAAEGILNNGSRIEGAQIVIGDNAVIENKSNVGQSMSRVINCDFSSVTIGDNATITMDIPNEWAEADANYANNCIVSEGHRKDGGRTVVTIGNNAAISVNNWYATGLYARSNGEIFVGDDLKLTTSQDGSTAVKSESNETGDWDNDGIGYVKIGDNAQIGTAGADSYAAYAYSDSGKDASSDIVIGRSADLTTTGKNAFAVVALGKGSAVSIGEGSRVSASGEGAYGVLVNDGGSVVFSGDQTIAATFDENSYAIGAGSTSPDYGTADVKADGVLHVTGGVRAWGYGSIDMTYRDGSTLDGFAEWVGDGSQLNMAMSASTWNMTKDSNLTTLKLENNSVVDFSGGGFKTLTVQDLQAGDTTGGELRMKTDIVKQSADLLKVTGTSAGDHAILVQNDGSAAATGKEIVPLVDTADGVATFQLKNDGQQVSLGGFAYTLDRYASDDTDWVLSSKGNATPPADGGINTFFGGYLLSYAETDTLIKRLGDLRDTPRRDGYWFRAYGGKFESNSGSFLHGFDMDYGGVQAGYDNLLERDRSWLKNGDTYVGGFIAYGRGDLDYSVLPGGTGGSGSVDSRTMGMYGTYIGDNGVYADLIVKYMWMMNKFDTLDTDGERVTGGKVHTGGIGASLELGKRIRFNGDAKKGWYVEPQLQLSYQRQDGGYFNASNGLRIGVEGFDSLIGRAGALLGCENEKTNFYVKAFYLKEFDGDISIYANGVPVGESFGDTWWVYGLGLTSKVNDKNSFYLDLERASGGKFSQPWTINAGWRILM